MFFKKKKAEKKRKEILLTKSTLFVFGVANNVISYMCDGRPFQMVHTNLIFEESEMGKDRLKVVRGNWTCIGGAVYQRVCVSAKFMQDDMERGLDISFSIRNLQLPHGYYQIVPGTKILIDSDFDIFPHVELCPENGSFVPEKGDEEVIRSIKLMLPGHKPEEPVTWEELPDEE